MQDKKGPHPFHFTFSPLTALCQMHYMRLHRIARIDGRQSIVYETTRCQCRYIAYAKITAKFTWNAGYMNHLCQSAPRIAGALCKQSRISPRTPQTRRSQTPDFRGLVTRSQHLNISLL